ncbi:MULTISPECIES: DUF4399 domain-containing protein [Halomonas]|uniref:Uncharacterized protein DUF4399 n=1 Tax=Halomonas ventosae TaxID=229007 RepID=A0A4R6GQE0_9GAMM|nr:DUF4399 domain-containing protein [Halomonas ventosae]TDN97307.1 uncharacterized protein DUF4399 [Halomonas ventosae]
MNHWIASLALVGGVLLAGPALAQMERAPAPEGAEVYFISPQDGATVENPVTVRMGLKGMGVAPAGTQSDGTGHHHLLIDTPLDEVNLDQPLPADEGKRHFGGGQTETTLELEPGEHSLQLLFMDGRHVSFDPPVTSELITITVQ